MTQNNNSYEEVLKREEVNGWFRYNESNTHIFFAKRMASGEFSYKSVEYSNN